MGMKVRTEFSRSRDQLRAGTVCTVVGVLALTGAVAVGVVGVNRRTVPAIILLGLVGLVGVGNGLAIYWRWLPRYRLSVGEDGVSVRTRGRNVHIAWSEIEAWSVTDSVPPRWIPEEVRRKVQPREILVAVPAAHVTEPARGARRVLWSRLLKAWVICEPGHLDGTTEELVEAFTTFAPDKQRHVPRSPAKGGEETAATEGTE
jgi:hypothetical protein